MLSVWVVKIDSFSYAKLLSGKLIKTSNGLAARIFLAICSERARIGDYKLTLKITPKPL